MGRVAGGDHVLASAAASPHQGRGKRRGLGFAQALPKPRVSVVWTGPNGVSERAPKRTKPSAAQNVVGDALSRAMDVKA